ncbi:MAG: hypothetical protein HOM58_22115 [Rhodospirillaceae bacterium]|jgi:hypothetical protein|nr:hypothetical protein [Rhodospirillaceae bacterium]MBT5457886.1 hypothetical protein [Rhodospirillaceae bacterium]
MSRWLRTICLMVAFTLPAAGVHAAGAVDELKRGPKVGAKIPHTLKVRDQANQYRDFKSLARRRGLIILFSRSLDW